MPFQNTIDKITVKGTTLKKAFEHAVSKWKPEDLDGKFLQVSGVKIVYDLSQPENSRVKQIRVRCADCGVPKYAPLELDRIYDVVTHTYVSGGGDGYTMLRDEKLSSDKSNVLDTDVVMDYFQTYKPLITGEELRIEFYDAKNEAANAGGTSGSTGSGASTGGGTTGSGNGTAAAPVQVEGAEGKEKPLGQALGAGIADAKAKNASSA